LVVVFPSPNNKSNSAEAKVPTTKKKAAAKAQNTAKPKKKKKSAKKEEADEDGTSDKSNDKEKDPKTRHGPKIITKMRICSFVLLGLRPPRMAGKEPIRRATHSGQPLLKIIASKSPTPSNQQRA
jgi:hypothetical protein